MKRIDTPAEIAPGDEGTGDWLVWALDPSGDGAFISAVFSGPEAEVRAEEYARAKFVGLRRHGRDQQQARSA